AHPDASRPVQHEVELVAHPVAMRGLRLSRLERVDVAEQIGRLDEIRLLHLLGGEDHAVGDALKALHDEFSSPPHLHGDRIRCYGSRPSTKDAPMGLLSPTSSILRFTAKPPARIDRDAWATAVNRHRFRELNGDGSQQTCGWIGIHDPLAVDLTPAD